MKKILFTITLLLLGLYYIDTQTHCITNRIYKIKDVAQKEKIVLHKIKAQEHVHSFFIHITGDIDGDAKIKLYNSSGAGLPYKYKNLSGDVNFKWGGDWYTDIIEMEYLPIDVKEGKLSIEYAFNGI